MLNLSTYPVISLPLSYSLDYRTLSRREAKDYYEWFIGQIPLRLNILQHLVAQDNISFGFSRNTLESLGRLLDENAELRDLTEDEYRREQAKTPAWVHPFLPDKVLSELTLSLVVDIGIFFAEMLRNNHPHLKWIFIDKPKNHVDFHQPVLSGFQHNIPLNPIGVMSVIAYKSVSGQTANSEILTIFEVWSEMAQS